MNKNKTFWFDPNPEHFGAIRMIDRKEKVIIGSDPDLPIWKVSFEKIDRQLYKIDFHTKKTHHTNKILYAKMTNRGNDLNFMINKDDKEYINTWKKIGQDPSVLIHYLNEN